MVFKKSSKRIKGLAAGLLTKHTSSAESVVEMLFVIPVAQDAGSGYPTLKAGSAMGRGIVA